MDESELKFKNRKFTSAQMKILEKAVLILSSNKSYYWTKDWILKYGKNR